MAFWDFLRKKGNSGQQTEQKNKKDTKKTVQAGNPASEDPLSSFKIRKPPYAASEIGKFLYTVEHLVLRDQFFANPEPLTRVIMMKNGLYDMISKAAEKLHQENPFQPDEIAVDWLRWNSDISLISIQFPEPAYSPLCYRIHLFFSDDYTHPGYYTIECGLSNDAFLCGWDCNKHIHYNEIRSAVWPEEQKEFWKALEAKILIDLHATKWNLNPQPDKPTAA